MKEQVIIAGFGGQGILLAGIILANAGMKDAREVSWLPSYGPEMRGGTANCHVVISDNQIGSPIIESPDCTIIMNKPSLHKFEPLLKKDGCMVINSSLVDVLPEREDISVFRIPANEIALELGNNKVANMVMLGAYVKARGSVPAKCVEASISSVLGEKNPKLTELNLIAFNKGIEYIGREYGYQDHKN